MIGVLFEKNSPKRHFQDSRENPKHELGISYQGIIANFLRYDNGLEVVSDNLLILTRCLLI